MDGDILFIDNDSKLRRLLKQYLEGYGFRLISLSSGARAMETLEERSPSLVILDVMMPGRSGLEILCQIRAKSCIPVIMLTARGEHTDRIVGLELGADDYLPKPFNPRELLARIRAILRRSEDDGENAGDGREFLEADGLMLHLARQRIIVDDKEIDLGPTEYRLLRVLMENADIAVSRDELMQRVWEKDFSVYDRSIDVYISKLRSLLRTHAGHENRIQTVRGVGYMFTGAK